MDGEGGVERRERTKKPHPTNHNFVFLLSSLQFIWVSTSPPCLCPIGTALLEDEELEQALLLFISTSPAVPFNAGRAFSQGCREEEGQRGCQSISVLVRDSKLHLHHRWYFYFAWK